MPDERSAHESSSVDLYWLPLGAGGHCVRFNGRLFEWFVSRQGHRPPCDLYHSALEVHAGTERWVVEMAPVWATAGSGHGGVCEGPVGLPWLGRSRLFRYEVRRSQDGLIPDVAEAVESPHRLSSDPERARRLLDLVARFPTATWGRDEQHTGEMWNSNSLTSWLLARSGHDVSALTPPAHGRAPGWAAGVVVAARESSATATAVELAGSARPTS